MRAEERGAVTLERGSPPRVLLATFAQGLGVLGVALLASVHGLRLERRVDVTRAALAATLLLFRFARERSAARSLLPEVLAGLIASSVFYFDIGCWGFVFALAAGWAVAALLLRGAWGEVRPIAVFLASAALTPALLVTSVRVLRPETWPSFANLIRVSLPLDRSWLELPVFAVLAAAIARSPRRRPASAAFGTVVALSLWLAVALQLVAIVGVVRLPTGLSNLGWHEPDYFASVLRIAHGRPHFEPPALFASHHYGPLLEWIGYRLLAPWGLGFSVSAHRLLTLGYQLAAVVLLAWVVGRRRPDGALAVAMRTGALALAVSCNFIAPCIHPDHALTLCFAGAFALLRRGRAWPRPLRLVAIGALPLVAIGFKLTGVALAVGLSIAFLLERRRLEAFVALAPTGLALLALVVAPAPLDRWFDYLVRLPSSHPFLAAARAPQVLLEPLLVAGAATLFVAFRRARGDALDRLEFRQHLALTVSVLAVGLAAWMRASGNENNLHLFLVGGVTTLLLAPNSPAPDGERAARPPRRTQVDVAAAATLLALLVHAAPRWPWPRAAEQASARVAYDSLVGRLRAERAAGRRVLTLGLSAAWAQSGHDEQLVDQAGPASHQFLARRRVADAFFEHLGDGRYEVVVVDAAMFPPSEFDARMWRALATAYDLDRASSTGAPASPWFYPVYRRRARGAPGVEDAAPVAP